MREGLDDDGALVGASDDDGALVGASDDDAALEDGLDAMHDTHVHDPAASAKARVSACTQTSTLRNERRGMPPPRRRPRDAESGADEPPRPLAPSGEAASAGHDREATPPGLSLADRVAWRHRAVPSRNFAQMERDGFKAIMREFRERSTPRKGNSGRRHKQ